MIPLLEYISDGQSFIGTNEGGCRLSEGDSNTVLANINYNNGPSSTSQCYSSEIKMKLKPTEKWGSCHTEHDEAYTHANTS